MLLTAEPSLQVFSFFLNKMYLFFISHVLVFSMHAYLCEGVTDSFELPCGCWELNLGPLEEQPVLIDAEQSLQPPDLFVCSFV